jgi:WD40 repeat protein
VQHDISLLMELPIRKCSLVRYSPGGNIFAAVGRSNVIVIYPAHVGGSSNSSSSGSSSTMSTGSYSSLAGVPTALGAGPHAPVAVLKAHVSTVTDLAFSRDGGKLISVGAGGAVYFWDVADGSRLMELEYVDKACVYYAGMAYAYA